MGRPNLSKQFLITRQLVISFIFVPDSSNNVIIIFIFSLANMVKTVAKTCKFLIEEDVS